MLVTSYWKRLTEKVEAGVDLNLQFMPGMGGRGGGLMMSGIRKEGQSTAGIKYDFRTGSVFRAQVDSTGSVSCLLDKRVGPMIQLNVAAQLDHGKVSLPVPATFYKSLVPEDTNSYACAATRQGRPSRDD